MKFIDLTREINNNTQVCPCDKVPVVEDYATTEEEGVNVKFMKMGTHTSTHIDAPYHISKEGRNLNDFPVDRFIGKGIVLDFSDRGEIYEITREDIMAHAEELKQVDYAILNTGWASYYGTWDFFRHPYLSGDAALALVELGIKIVGTDGSSADAAYGFSTAKRLENPTFSEILENIERENIKNDAHTALLGNDCLIVEYLCNLDQLPKEAATYSFLPLKLVEADGSPVRAVCMTEE
ncbi:cyclase [Lachnospiraceae bacterium]|uniref:cyclase family protein n=1 Tax=Extibacter sp. GGCC_0201 TaxID=2731209 RepID=UPI001AA113AF|nr:cyclase family protein [Extibacter sp. GGCC_0201]MBO1722340.1 cyclase family protein [Extibacter sp. GGCC_0201]BDF32793.1 cyclase [Lachnospiraceae bacterium]BDF36798.1 cyclase [Lachnospiraceae bacterium]